ncbi:Hypothetical predicted protein [Mytilus galloprovincialis]|uniref:Uncharacterized protein n=1 Tax=Mytilus galloprovincialis TaxID=29158 RepID=A0A8B6CSU2_MYTGA|nr:Hypothetical predicted protein [Mytilus galloprovincialis]
MPFGTSTGWAKWAFVIMCIAPILFIVGFATNYWMQNDSTTVTSVGLWKAQTCTSGTCDTQSVPSSYKNDNFRATQAFEIMALIMFLATPVFLGIYVFAAGARTYNYAVFCMVMCFVTAAIALIGVFIWLAYIPTNFYMAWSCGMVILAAIMAIIAGLLLIPELGWCSSYSNSGYYSSNMCAGVCGGDCCECDCDCCREQQRTPSPTPPPTRKALRSDPIVSQPARWVYTGSSVGYPPNTGMSSAYPPSTGYSGLPPSTGLTSLSGRPPPFTNRAALLFTGSVLWIFALLTNFSIAWSYGLTLVALILAIIAGILFVPEVQNFNYFYGHYEDEYDTYYEKKSRISPGNYTKNYSPRQPRYARNIDSPPSTSSTSGSGRTISTSMSNSTTYDSMPQPMAVDNPNTLKVNNVSNLQNSRPTFNDVSAIKLQRDQVF